MYSDGRWPIQNGNAPVYDRENTSQGQRGEFQGVVVPVNGSRAHSNIVRQTNNHVSALYISNGVSQVEPRNFPPSQTSHLDAVPSNGVRNFDINGGVSWPTPDRQISTAPSLDYQLLLLCLAEDYLVAAHSEGSMVALLRHERDIQRYYKLIATGLGCLEAVLKVSKWHLIIYRRIEFIVVSIGE